MRADGETDEHEVRSYEEEVRLLNAPEEKPEVHNEWCEPYLKWLEVTEI